MANDASEEKQVKKRASHNMGTSQDSPVIGADGRRTDAVMKDQRHPNSIERGVDVLFMSQLQGHENVVEDGTSLQADEVRKTGHVHQQAHAPLASTTAPAGTTATAATASSFSTPASTSKLQTVNVSTMPRSCSPTEEDRLTTWKISMEALPQYSEKDKNEFMARKEAKLLEQFELMQVFLEVQFKLIQQSTALLHRGIALLQSAMATLRVKTEAEKEMEVSPSGRMWATYLSRKADYLVFRKLEEQSWLFKRLLRELKETTTDNRAPTKHSESAKPAGVNAQTEPENAAAAGAEGAAQREVEEVVVEVMARGGLGLGSPQTSDALVLFQNMSPSLIPFQGPDYCWSRLLLPDYWQQCQSNGASSVGNHKEVPTAGAQMLQYLCTYLEPMVFTRNATLIRAHTMGTRMYFVQSGTCKVIVDGVVKATRSRGDFIGEIALVYASERMADVVADGDVEAYALSRPRFLQVATRFPEIYERLKQIGAERVNRQGWAEKMDKWKHHCVALEESSHDEECAASHDPESAVLVSFSDMVLDALSRLPPDLPDLHTSSPTYSSEELSDIIHRLMSSFTLAEYSAGQVIIEHGSCEMGIKLVCAGSAVVHKGGRTTELEAGTYMGLISVFFTGTALHDVCAGARGAKVWVLERLRLMNLCEDFPRLQDALRAKALLQTAEVAKFPHLSSV